jgi:signal transduction histidine kinase
MMRRWHRRPGRPPWWPEGEPWPASDRSGQWHAGRARYFRRFVWIALAFFLLSASGALSLAWFAAGALGVVSPEARGGVSIVLGGAMFGIAAAVVALVGTMRRVGLPLRSVMEAADRVAAGDYTTRVAERGPPPIRALASAFNTMTERLESHDRMRRDLMADVAHELRTPLTVMQGRLEGLLDGVYARDDSQVAELLGQTQILARLVEDLRTLALSESGSLRLQIEPTDLGALALDATRALAGEASTRQVTLVVDAAADLKPLDVDPLRIREVLTNLVSNALRHSSPGGKVEVHITETTLGIAVEVRDTGAGMTDEELARAFDRFYRGPASKGSGLGLSIARSLVAAHGGGIQASSAAGRGTTIVFTLPRRLPS